MNYNFNRIFREFLENNSISVRKAADLFGVAPRSISNWKRGIIPRIDMLKKISKEIGVDVDTLLEEVETD